MARYMQYPPCFEISNGQSYTVANKTPAFPPLMRQNAMTVYEAVSEWITEAKDFTSGRTLHYLIRCRNDADALRRVVWLPVSIEFCEDHLLI
jgi:hypothetical protein